MLKIRKLPTCRGTATDGSPCGERVERDGDTCVRCLERLAHSDDATARRELAHEPDLPPHLFPVLAEDGDRGVRLAVAERFDCPLPTLQRLEGDRDHDVRAAATVSMSTALTPRVLTTNDEALFSEAEIDALSRVVRPGSPADPFADPAGPATDPFAGPAAGRLPQTSELDEICRRLDALGDRLALLEAAVTASEARLAAITERLDDPAPAARQ